MTLYIWYVLSLSFSIALSLHESRMLIYAFQTAAVAVTAMLVTVSFALYAIVILHQSLVWVGPDYLFNSVDIYGLL
jgi:hypothetical protein